MKFALINMPTLFTCNLVFSKTIKNVMKIWITLWKVYCQYLYNGLFFSVDCWPTLETINCKHNYNIYRRDSRVEFHFYKSKTVNRYHTTMAYPTTLQTD